MLLDFALISVLLVVAHALRSRIGLLRRFFVPTPVVAGFLGLLGSDQGLGVIPFHEVEPGKPAISTYPSVLVVLLFATLFMGFRSKTSGIRAVARQVGDTFFYNLAAEFGQWGIALLFGALVLSSFFPHLNSGFALLLPAGFVGGHGTAAAVAGALQESGWEEALTVGYTFATAGLLSAIAGGILLANIGARNGWTRCVPSGAGSSPDGELHHRPETVGRRTVNVASFRSLTWHVALVFVAYAMAHGVNLTAESISQRALHLPLFALSLLAGGVIQKALGLGGLGKTVNRNLMVRIGSSISDYLIAFGIASVQISVVVKYVVPLSLLCVLGVSSSLALFWFVGRRIFHNYWFERSLFVYGWNTGVVAIAIALLRVVDPRLRSQTLEDFGLAYLFISFATLTIITVLPQLVVRGAVLGPALFLLAAFVACVLCSRHLVGWFSPSPRELRDGETRADV